MSRAARLAVEGETLALALTPDERSLLEQAYRACAADDGRSLEAWARDWLLMSVPEISNKMKLPERLDRLERALVCAALFRAGSNRSRAADLLGISRRMLLAKLDNHALKEARRTVAPRRRRRGRFTKTFKRVAVDRALAARNTASVALQLDLSEEVLRDWIKEAGAGGETRAPTSNRGSRKQRCARSHTRTT